MNSDTFACFSSLYPTGHPFALPASITTTTTTETAFLLANGNPAVINLPTGKEILGSQTPFSPNANATYAAESGRAGKWLGETRPFFNSSSFNNRPFRLRASGFIAGGGTTLTSIAASINVYASLTTATVVTSGTKIAGVAITGGIGNTSANWMVEMILQWDSVSQILSGFRNTFVGNLLTAGNQSGLTLTNSISGITLTSINFGATWVFATTSTANTVGLVELALEMV
jgi:hypothetical protein